MSHGLSGPDPDVSRGARLRADGGVLPSLLCDCDVGAQAPAAGRWHLRHASHQCRGAQSVVPGHVLRHRHPLACARHRRAGTLFGTGGPAIWSRVACFVGTFLVTVLFNVPLNNRLATVKPESAEGKAIWTHYLSV